jgi:hypothetical protein
LSYHFQGLRRTFFEICTEFDAFPLSDPSRNRIRSGTRRNNEKDHRVAWHFVHWLLKYASTIIHRRIVIL